MPNYSLKKDCEVKSPIIAFILCLFLGHLGIHQFYLGNIKRGIMYLIVGIFTWGFNIWYMLDPVSIVIIGTLRTIASIAMLVLIVIDAVGLGFSSFAKRGKSKDDRLYDFELHFVDLEDRCYLPLSGDKDKELPFVPIEAIDL